MPIKLTPKKTFTLSLDGTNLDVEQIGKGRYTTAFRVIGQNIVYTKTHEKDSGKEILSNLDNPHIPHIEFVGPLTDNYRVYRMLLYQPLKAKHKNAWKYFRTLERLWNDARQTTQRESLKHRMNAWDSAENLNNMFQDMVECDPTLPQTIKDAITDIRDNCMNYGAYSIEISKHNCAVSETGDLILLDPVFDLKEVWDSRAAKRARF